MKSFEARVLDPKKLAFISELQIKLLKNSLNLVKPQGGTVIYATCSLSASQNEDIIQQALSDPNYVDCKLVDAFEWLDPVAKISLLSKPEYGVIKSNLEGCYRFLPDSLSTGGLFMAKIIRNKSV